MASDKAFAADVVRRLVGFGPVTTRAMFGGFGVHCDGVMFGLIAYDTLYFRVDDGNLDDYRAAGAPPFTYDGKRKPVQMPYYQVPDPVFDDPETLAAWAEKALIAARRAKAAKRPSRRAG